MDGQAERLHARFSPSAMERIELCPGSPALVDRLSIPPMRTIYSEEGDKAHLVVQRALETGVRSAHEAHEDSVVFDQSFEKDFFLSIQTMLNYTYGILDQYPDAVLYTERRVDPPSEAAPGEAAGYCDVAIYIPSIRTLYVIDYKHGAGVAKDIELIGGSPQPWQYAAGFLYEPSPTVDPDTVDTVILAIIQPRCFHPLGPIREVETTTYGVFEYLDRMDRAIFRAQDANAPLIPGDTQCFFCPAKVECPARMARGLKALGPAIENFRQIDKPSIPNPIDLTPEEVGYIGTMLPFLKSWIKDFEARRLDLMQQGYNVQGFKVVETQARRKWFGEPADVAEKLAALIGCKVDDVMEYKLIGVTEAQELVQGAFKATAARGQKKQATEAANEALAHLTLKESSGNLTVVPETDYRPAVIKGPGLFAQLGQITPPGEGE